MTENEYVNKQAILDAIKSTKPEPSEYMDMTDNIVVNTIILGAAVKQYEDIVKIVEAAQPTECKPVVHGYWKKYTHYNVVGISEGYQCSVCGEGIGYNEYGNYKFSCFCHECGAKMDESEDNNAVDGTADP